MVKGRRPAGERDQADASKGAGSGADRQVRAANRRRPSRTHAHSLPAFGWMKLANTFSVSYGRTACGDNRRTLCEISVREQENEDDLDQHPAAKTKFTIGGMHRRGTRKKTA